MAADLADGADATADADADAPHSSSSSWRPKAASLAASFASRGFDLAHPFSVAAFNRGLSERHEAAVAAAAAKGDPPPPPPPFLPTGTRKDPPALLVGNTGAVFWESFLRWTCRGSEGEPTAADAADADAASVAASLIVASLPPDPLDSFVEAAVKEALDEAPISPQPLDVRFSHVVRPRDRFVDVLRAAAGSGMAYFSIAAHLCAHPTAGPFFSLRAVIVLDAEAADDDAEEGEEDASSPSSSAANDADVERLMEASARAAEAAWGAAGVSSTAAKSAAEARDAVRALWLKAYGALALSNQRPRDTSPFSAEDEERVAAMYRALFAAMAPAAAKAETAKTNAKDEKKGEEGHERYRAAAKEKRPWREEAWRGWAEARAALGGDKVAPRWRFSEAQIHYHYTRDRKGLQRELERVLLGLNSPGGGGGGSGGAGRAGRDDEE
jgi:hypothetical protein